jgi:hypothetical protein
VDRTVKGSHVVQAMEWIDNHLGEGTFKSWTKAAGPRWSAPLPSSWYDVSVIREAIHKASEALNIPMEDVATEISRLNAERDLTSTYRFFMRIAQPQRVLSFTPKLWRTYVSWGDATAMLNEKGHYIGQGEGFPPELLDWGCGCWRGFIPATIELAGGKNPRGSITKRWKMPNNLYAVQFEVTYS